MSTISNVDQVLAQMRQLAAAAQGVEPQPGQSAQALEGGGDADFASLLKQSVDKVNELQQESGRLSEAFSAGDPNVDLGEVMIALQKAGVAFQAMTQVRNKLVDAYREVMSMQV